MNKRKMKKQITLGNSFMPTYIGDGRINGVVNSPINNQLSRFNNGENPIKVKRQLRNIRYSKHIQINPQENNRRSRRIGIEPKIRYTPFERLDNIKELLS